MARAVTSPPYYLYFRPMVQAYFMWRDRRRRCSVGMAPARQTFRGRYRRLSRHRYTWLLRDWNGPIPRLRR